MSFKEFLNGDASNFPSFSASRCHAGDSSGTGGRQKKKRGQQTTL